MKLSKLRELPECPNWLKSENIEVSEEDINIVNGVVIWENGIWEAGIWEVGIWEAGIWEAGIWKGGIWKGGIWKSGNWERGNWESGIWGGGIWEGGLWGGGIWKGGIWKGGLTPTGRCKWSVFYDFVSGIIHIGCETKTIKEWEEWFAGSEEYETKRGTVEFREIYKSFLIAKAAIEIENSAETK